MRGPYHRRAVGFSATSLALLAAVAVALVLPHAMAAQLPQPTQTAEPAATVAPAPQRGVRDAAELEAFIDGVMAGQLRRQHVAGATVSVVKDGKLLFAKGYGYADVEKRKPVNPATTLFRIGSVSKLFTWTAVMQLVEQGKLDLDTDINKYLDFKIPDTYEQPITLRHLMTHTPGFEEDSRGLISDDSSDLQPMSEWLPKHIPTRVRPPGTYSAYSNYGATLAGYIVQRASGMSWEEYTEKFILEPLGMSHTTARQPLPAALKDDMSVGYKYGGGTFKPKKFEVVLRGPPAGSVSSTAEDMAKFMLAHLGGGALDGKRILGEATTERMHERVFGHDPRLAGWALGFYEVQSHGLRLIGHGGDTQWFHSDMMLIPSENTGVFVSYNTDRGGQLSFGPFLEAFLDHYYPTPTPVATFPPDAVDQARHVAGVYQANRMSYTTWQKAAGLAGGTTVAPDKDGALLVGSGSDLDRYVPVGPSLYRQELGHELIAFKADSSGGGEHAFLSNAPMMAFVKVPWYGSPKLHLIILGLATVVFVGVIAAAARRLYRHWFGDPLPADAFPGRKLLVGLALANVAFVVALGILISDIEALLLGNGTGMKIALAFPVIGAILTIIALVVAVQQWRKGTGTKGFRVRYDIVVALALLFMWSLNYWNLLGWRV
ncbi:MAG TPA: serine hydrolase domain-containing protein [Gemmatimonadaceae bacterium]|nr:serine hydrolase domain-containing protein [Gemmatimonadaceae bacterium]